MTDPIHPASGDLEAVALAIYRAAWGTSADKRWHNDVNGRAHFMKQAEAAITAYKDIQPANPVSQYYGLTERPANGVGEASYFACDDFIKYDRTTNKTNYFLNGVEVTPEAFRAASEAWAGLKDPASHDALIARVRELEEALKPFARWAANGSSSQYIASDAPDDAYPAAISHKVGAYRAAMKALTDLDARDGG